MKRLLALLFSLVANTALAQNITCPTRPVGDSTNACASTAFVLNQISASVLVTSISNADGTLTIAPTTGAAVASLNLSHANTWTALQTFNSGATANNTPGGTALTVNSTFNSVQSASIITGNGSGTTGGLFWNNWAMANDAINAGVSNVYGLVYTDFMNSSTIQGGRVGISGRINQSVVTNASNANRAYVGVEAVAITSSGDGGTNTGAGALGGYFGANLMIQSNGATNALTTTGVEVDWFGTAGSTQKYKWGINIADGGPTHGASSDAAIVVYALNSALGFGPGAGWNQVLSLAEVTSSGRSPINSGTTIFGTHLETLGSFSATNGIDWSAITFSNKFLNSVGFSVDGSGNLLANNVTTAWTAFTPSPSCGTATFTVNSARARTVGKTTFAQFDATITAIGTCTVPINFTLPNTAQSSGSLTGQEVVANGIVDCRIAASSATASCVGQGAPNFLVNQHIIVSGVYENQ